MNLIRKIMSKPAEKELSVEDPDLDLLVEKVKELVDNPISVWAVAATLESMGIRDIDAKKDYQHESVFALADYVYNNIKKMLQEERGSLRIKEGYIDEDKFTFGNAKKTLKLFLKHYSAGLVFSVPMFSQVIAILLFEYALWAWFKFNEAQATVVAFGTIVAFVVTGGFIQSLGRMISKYVGEDNFYLARKATNYIIGMALFTTLLAGVLLFLVNVVLPFFPVRMMTLGLIYMALISILLLTSGILYALKQRSVIILSVVSGTVLVILGMEFFNIGIYFSQWMGIALASIMMYIYSTLYYRIKIYSLRQQLYKQALPEAEVNYYNNYRYFVYGFVYFLFLFMDRILAWSTGETALPYVLWFNTPYELGMDWALITLVITVAVLEYSIHAFSDIIIPAQKKASFDQTKLFNTYFKKFYMKQVVLLLVVGVLSIIITYYGVLALKFLENDIPEIRDFFANPITYEIFWIASIGYLLLIYGLMNALFFFTLNRPEFVLYTMLGALTVNFVVGFVCSRMFEFHFAVLGLIAGSLFFAVSTGIVARRFFKHLDYFYYSAY